MLINKANFRFRRLGRRAWIRASAAWLASFMLVFQFWTPMLYAVASPRPAMADPAYAELVRALGTVPVCTAWQTARSDAKRTAPSPIHDPFQCPVCQSIHLLGGLVLPAIPKLAVPPLEDALHRVAAVRLSPPAAPIASFAARAPPRAA